MRWQDSSLANGFRSTLCVRVYIYTLGTVAPPARKRETARREITEVEEPIRDALFLLFSSRRHPNPAILLSTTSHSLLPAVTAKGYRTRHTDEEFSLRPRPDPLPPRRGARPQIRREAVTVMVYGRRRICPPPPRTYRRRSHRIGTKTPLADRQMPRDRRVGAVR